MKTKDTYCTTCREVKPHSLAVDKNGEIVATCTVCEHFFKIAAGTPVPEMKAEIANREELHKDLMTVEEEEKRNAESEKALDELFADEPVEATPVEVVEAPVEEAVVEQL